MDFIETISTIISVSVAISMGLFCLFFVAALTILNSVGASSGQHTGYVTAVERNSNLVWASNIVYFKTDAQSSQEDKYCVNDPQVKTFLEDASMKKTPVTISYQNDFFVWAWQCNGGESIITKVSW